jgi:RNA polymerase sigma-70 factor, ECF subfamily
MSTDAGVALPTFSVSLGNAVLDGLAELKSKVSAATAHESAFNGPLSAGNQANRKSGFFHRAEKNTHRQKVEERTESMASDRADNAHSAQAPQTQQATMSSADLDRMDVRASLAGDQTAFANLVTRYQSAVYNMAYRMLGDPTEAEDAAQEVFVRAWNQLHTFQMDKRFSTWLLSIASHHAIDVLRRRKPSAPLDDVALYVQSDEPEPDELALRGEQRDMVQKLINTLPEKYRSVTVLRYYNDLSYDEIARMTGLTESAVKTQLHRARRMLADQLIATGEVNGAGSGKHTVARSTSKGRKEVRSDALPGGL